MGLVRPLLKTLVVGAAAAGSIALLPAPEAKAACIGGDSVCTTFDPSTISNPTAIGGFDGSLTLASGQQLNRFRIRFKIANYIGAGFTLDNIFLSGDGITGSKAVPSVNIPANGGSGTTSSSYVILDTALTNGMTLNYNNSAITFRIPVGLNASTSITSELFYASTSETDNVPDNSLTSGSDFTTIATVVPGPLPLLGAGVAFAYSRKLRRRLTPKK